MACLVSNAASTGVAGLLDYRPGLPASSAHGALKSALEAWQRAEKCAVLWFAEIHRRSLFRDLGYSSIQQYAGEALGFSESRTKQFLRLAEALERLPQLRRSLADGRIGWTKARVVARVATPENESRWLEVASTRNRAALEAKAAAVRARANRMRAARGEAARVGARREAESNQGSLVLSTAPAALAATLDAAALDAAAPDAATLGAAALDPVALEDATLAADLPINLTLRFTPEQYARYETLIEKLRKVGSRAGVLPKDARREELILAGLDALLIEMTARGSATLSGRSAPASSNATACASTSHSVAGGGVAAAPDTRVSFVSPYQIVIYKCETCTRSEVRTTVGARRVGPATLAAASCDARIVIATTEPIATTLATQRTRSKATIPPAVRRTVLVRDGHRCQAPGCGRTRFLEVHHRVPRADGGANCVENLVTLCSACHHLAHEAALTACHGSALHRRE